jgi:hypothetical protein
MVLDPTLREELLALRAEDERTRARLAASGELFGGYAREMEVAHLANARRLDAILDRVGWPAASVAGEDGRAAAWLVAQHAISWPAFQLRCLELLRDAVAAGEAPLAQLAYLTDRIRFNQRRPQVYGTIFDWDEEGRLSPWAVEDPASVDQLRREAGLPPLAQVTERQRAEARSEGDRPPGDFAARQREIQDWARAVGWLP